MAGDRRNVTSLQEKLLMAAQAWGGSLMIVVPPDGEATVRVDRESFGVAGGEVEDLVERGLVKPMLAWILCEVTQKGRNVAYRLEALTRGSARDLRRCDEYPKESSLNLRRGTRAQS